MRLLAYLDPGSASALLAAILAGVAGLGAAFRTYGRNFLDTLMFWRKGEPTESDTPRPETSDEETGAQP